MQYVLINYYAILKSVVGNDDLKSSLFRTTIGFKQSGPLSPRLFAIYIDEVVNRIEKLNRGIRIGNELVNIFLYAVEIILRVTNKADMQTLINEVET